MLSIVLPAYNGSYLLRKEIPSFQKYLRELSIPFEIIVVDDGSKDQNETEKICKEMNCKYIGLAQNQGKGAAVRQGILSSEGEYILFTDADIPFQYKNINEFYHTLLNEKVDLVVGDRGLEDSSYFTKISWLRKLGSDIFSFVVSRFFTDGLDDTQCGLKAFTREAALSIFNETKINGFAFDVEVLYLALIKNYKRVRKPVQLRSNESSSVRVVYHGIGMLKDLVRIRYYHKKNG